MNKYSRLILPVTPLSIALLAGSPGGASRCVSCDELRNNAPIFAADRSTRAATRTPNRVAAMRSGQAAAAHRQWPGRARVPLTMLSMLGYCAGQSRR